MHEFPSFMKNKTETFPPVSKWKLGGQGSVFEGADGVRVAFWSYLNNEMSDDGANTCDEHVFVVEGSYILVVGGEAKPVLMPGDSFSIPRGVVGRRKVIAGTRVIHAFGGGDR